MMFAGSVRMVLLKIEFAVKARWVMLGGRVSTGRSKQSMNDRRVADGERFSRKRTSLNWEGWWWWKGCQGVNT